MLNGDGRKVTGKDWCEGGLKNSGAPLITSLFSVHTATHIYAAYIDTNNLIAFGRQIKVAVRLFPITRVHVICLLIKLGHVWVDAC